MVRKQYLDEIRHARRLMRGATNRLNDFAIAAFPIDSKVSFSKGNGHITARILKHSRGLCGDQPRFLVRNLKTLREYWVTLFDILPERIDPIGKQKNCPLVGIRCKRADEQVGDHLCDGCER